MKKKYLILAAMSLLAVAACQNRTDEHAHDHETEAAAEAHEHEGEAAHGEIVLSPERAREAGVEVETITPGSFRTAIRTSGVLSPAGNGSATISSRTAGILTWSGDTPAPGRRVTDGEVIARVSAGGMGEGDAVTRAAIAYEAAKTEYERAKTLLEDKIISQREFTTIEADYKTALNAYQGTTADGAGDGVAVSSPLAGYITDVLKTEGDYVNAGEAIATVASDTRLRLVADLPEKYAALRNSIALTPGSYVEVWLLTEERDGVVSVPETALTEEQGEHFVYVQLDEECYRKVPVTVGGRNGIAVEILSGLKGGEKVVVKGAYQVRLSSASVIPGHTHNH